MDKEKLDKILNDYKVQPVGKGYIDLIVSRELYKQFVRELIENGFMIKSVSWWEWCADNDDCKYGLGGPESNFDKGWFAELPIDVDDIELSDLTPDKAIANVINLIDSKSIQYPDEMISFNESNWLTPAIWLDVPDNWINKFN
jgi:hypothetical protein